MQAPFIIGIGGGTGAGKSRLAENLAAALDQSTFILLIDRYLKNMDEIPRSGQNNLNFDTAAAFHMDEVIAHLRELKAGRSISLPIYNRDQHLRSPIKEAIALPQVLIVEGIMTFVFTQLRSLCDLKLAVETPSDIRLLRRIQIDMEQRGLRLERVVKRYPDTVIPEHNRTILPANRYADIHIDGTQSFDHIISIVKEQLKAIFHS